MNLEHFRTIQEDQEIHYKGSDKPTGNEQNSEAISNILSISLSDEAARVITSLLKWAGVTIYRNQHFFVLMLRGSSRGHSPRWASNFDKLKGVVRDTGVLIVQAPYKRTDASIPGWYLSNNTILSFIDAVHVCRQASKHVKPGEYSEILGGPEERLSSQLHATLISALSILSIVGGSQLIQQLVNAILGIDLNSFQPLPDTGSKKDWQGLSRIKCLCESQFTHGPLTPVGAAKAIGIDVWKEREEQIITRVWDINQDKLVKNVDVRKVIFITHRWNEGEVEYSDLASANSQQQSKISEMSTKLLRIRKILLQHTRYVWMDTICIDKSNSSELDEAIRSMYKWYANCRAVVLDGGTLLNVWKGRGWCLQEGAATGALYAIHGGMYGEHGGRLVSIAYLAEKQETKLCDLDLSLYYRPGNAAEILARMDRRQTTKKEDMAYALIGIFSIHFTVAYGEGHRARERLLKEIASQTGDLSYLSFSTSQKHGRNSYLPAPGDMCFPLTNYEVSSTPTMISHLGLTVEVKIVDWATAEADKVLLGLEYLEKYSHERCMEAKKFINLARSPSIKKTASVQMAIVSGIRSIMLLELHGQDQQTGGNVPIKCFHRLQCCQVEADEFQRIFGNFGSKAERIWLGDDMSTT